MSLHPAVVFLGGLAIIIVGAELLLRGSVRLAAMLGVRPMMIGLTVVAVGTSMPELAVGVTAALAGSGELVVSNIAGTNIFNILLILGLSATIRPLPLQLQAIRLDVPVMIAAALALLLLSLDGSLGRLEGLLFLAAAAAYTTALIRLSRRESRSVREEFAGEYGPEALRTRRSLGPGIWNAALLVAGIALTIYGADFMVEGAVELARSFGVSEAVIGLTIVAIGTSAPELVTTLLATLKDERDVAVGNLLGSSISNILVVLGLTCVVAPEGIVVSPEILRIDLPLALAVAAVCWPVFRSGRRVSRGEGVAFVGAYLMYMASLLLLRT